MSIIERAVGGGLGKEPDKEAKPDKASRSAIEASESQSTPVERESERPEFDAPLAPPADTQAYTGEPAQPQTDESQSLLPDDPDDGEVPPATTPAPVPSPVFGRSRPTPQEVQTLKQITRDKFVNLPFDDLRSAGILTPAIPRSAIAEEFRTIKRPLLKNISGDAMTDPIKQGNLIMVTSALEGDGKTFTSISLAISIAMEQDKTVLFIDADTAKAEAGRMLGIPPHCPGLIDVLENSNMHLADVTLQTNIEKLRVVPAGDLHTHANELLASERMRQLMHQISEEYSDRVVVFDSPPLLLTTEAAVLTSFMGQIVFVVAADMTPQHAVNQAIEHIGEDKMVGMVLNRARRRSNPYFYSYGDLYGRHPGFTPETE
ncbi:MAG: XrtA-associated tyrosine autokinase [Pseudomonadota bacterium]